MARDEFSETELDEAEARLKRLARNPRFISGMYNYCDRWCERCPMTSRCLLFAQENAERRDAAKRDVENAQFWRTIAKQFAVAERMILRDAKKGGIDLTLEDPEVERKLRERQDRRARVKKLDTPKMAMRYTRAVDAWFESHKEQFGVKEEELQSALVMQIEGQEPEADAREIIDGMRVIRWYQHQIFVKLSRALSGLEDARGEQDADSQDWARHDAEGSGKVALIGIDRSIAAWARMREHFPDESDRTLDTLVLLDRLRKAIEQVLPRARQFQRVGFDFIPEKPRSPRGAKKTR